MEDKEYTWRMLQEEEIAEKWLWWELIKHLKEKKKTRESKEYVARLLILYFLQGQDVSGLPHEISMRRESRMRRFCLFNMHRRPSLQCWVW